MLDVLLDIWRETGNSDGGFALEVSLPLVPDESRLPLTQTELSRTAELRWRAIQCLKSHGVVETTQVHKARNPRHDRIGLRVVPARLRAMLQCAGEKLLLAGGNRTAYRKVFIGHGHSNVWHQLKDFLSHRLKLEWVEFNRQSTAGLATKERLEQMLSESGFAFLVMTGEEARPEGTFHARDNVIHETGLFQGRLGFRKAILLLEEGCRGFSNIEGLTYIPFPPGNILASSEQIREVLEREGLLGEAQNES